MPPRSCSLAALTPGCAAYDAKTDSFLFDLKTSKSLAPATYVITIRVFAGTDVVNEVSIPVSIKA